MAPAEYEHTADIPIRHRFVDYVCTIRYSEYESGFQFLASRYANPARARSRQKNGMTLYLRILSEPSLRATLLESLVPNSEVEVAQLREKAISERGGAYGFWVGFAVFWLLGYCLYRLTVLLARNLGHDWAEIITYIPSFIAFVVVFPVQRVFEHWYIRRYCGQYSHCLEKGSDPQGREITWCKRCGLHFSSSDFAGDT